MTGEVVVPGPVRRFTPWASVVALTVLAGAAATASALTSPGPTSGSPSSLLTATSPPAGALTIRIRLPSTTLVAGATVHGTLVVTNHTHTTFNLTHGCRPHWGVGLGSSTIPFSPAFTTECASAPLLVPPGVNRLPFTLFVTYLRCLMSGTGSTPDFPACVNGNQMPPLPPGRYQAQLVSETPALSAAPVEVTVVAVATTTTTTTEVFVTPPTSSTTTTVIATPSGTLVLTQSSAGQSYAVAPGQLVQVVLPGTGQQYQGYVTPESDTSAVEPDGHSCSAPPGNFCTEFVGTSAGMAHLASTTDQPCRRAVPPCLVPTMEWRVDLTVRE